VTQLIGAYPNPFNPSTTISYAIDHPCVVRLEVFNSRGQLVRSITENHNQPGFYSKIWDGKSDLGVSVGSGIYLYRMSAGSFSSTKRFIMLK
jgi:flagellar hook assembly protein FlgD